MSVYRRIADEIAARIAAGEPAPGERIMSTRQIMAEYGVAMATATKVITLLREEGLVRTRPGVGTVVAVGARPAGTGPDRDLVVRTAITIADSEGLAGLSMRRLAGELGIPTMSVYRHVADKEELVLLMMDKVMAANPPPPLMSAERDGWRACVEALARLQWSMYRRHTWLAMAVSFTRPLLAPNAMAHTEWTMRALDGFGLDPRIQFRAAVTVANYVRGTAVNLEEEAQAEQETGMTDLEWLDSQQQRFTEVLATGKLPLMARFITGEDHDFDLDTLLEYGLQRLLDGLETQLTPPAFDGTGRKP
ncbi:TetR/AcrR family transcriptional regulator C-terminal domain-containing protein [Actinoplanes sp. LDG1-06]|uniref:TetR/AcrR family transcriptional regulator C-terminal domain-containing protein n=1 Tax=Paractinoplanes ovalisporus TaxID=2810368 RepID=A0ABS2A5S3_9ACTN|nr:TetR/AcrR family transcriptional regulator C-terminal domain-containing protein [Actinoplanes ovalisporus]MBM2614648.1 TetR/AcrR family transcriptional regulator C-terminal domain-containing protein [Actinoplanes ovalisporus]